MENSKLKVWSCIALLLVWSFAGLQGDVRLEPLQTVNVMAQTAPQECKDAAGATIPCPPDDEDRGRTDCEDTDRDGVCDSQEPSECVGQLDELGNGCAADDDQPGVRIAIPNFVQMRLRPRPSTPVPAYPQPDCNDPDGGLRYELVNTLMSNFNPSTGCPDPEPVFDCELSSPFSFCNTFASEDDGSTEACIPYPDGSQHCCAPGACVCTGFDACNDLIANCIGGGHKYEGDSDGGSCTRK